MSDNSDFVERFIEACGTDKPAAIADLLGMRYQSVRNYLKGRLPSAEVLITISNKTLYSIDWLLTGRGKKFRYDGETEGTPVPPRQIEAIARRVIVEVINEINASPETAQQKIVRLQSSELVSDRAPELLPKP
jgi:hypothetical protein